MNIIRTNIFCNFVFIIFDKYFTSATKIISLTHVSNVLGTINPISKIAKIAQNIGSVFIVDGAQGVPHQSVNVQELG